MADPHWTIHGVGDVNGDGYADLVWQHSQGWLAVWYMRGTAVVGTRYLSIDRVSDPNWQIVGVTDTNGDGMADLLWQERTQGWLAVWFLHGTTW